MGKKKPSNTRQQIILEQLRRAGRIQVNELSNEFGVSPITIRRDLDSLSEQGLVDRTHGGAFLKKNITSETPFSTKGLTHTTEKALIGAAAARLVPPETTVFLNSGSTTLEVLKRLQGEHIRVMTNNVAAFGAPRDPSIELFLVGGECRDASRSLVGDLAIQSLSQVFSDFTFLGINGVDPYSGLTSTVQQEVSINRTMLNRCNGQRIVVADNSKIGVVAGFITAGLESVDLIITDAGADSATIQAIESTGTRVLVCSHESLNEQNEQ